MKRKIYISAIISIIIISSSVKAVFSQTMFDLRDSDDKFVTVQLLWLIEGAKDLYECEVPETDQGSTLATCHDHEIIDLHTNRVIGTATDATTDVTEDGEGLIATGTTFFHLRQGDLVIRGRGTIQPMLEGEPILNNAHVTHIAGIFPEPDANNVIDGTGLFKDAEGTFSLLGALDLTNMAEGQSQFHCVYLINLRLKRGAIRGLRQSGTDMGPFANIFK